MTAGGIVGRRCLVLGAGGFIGVNLCRGLVAAGAEVTGYGRYPQEAVAGLDTLPWHQAEFADEARMARALEGQEVVYHLLGGSVPAQSNDDPVGDVTASLLPSLRLIQSCRELGVRRIVFASSGGTVYGPTSARPVAETAPTAPITAYGINKLAVERYLGLSRALHGLDPVVLRISNPYGPFQHRRRPQGVVGTALARAVAGEPIEVWGDGSVVRDYLHIDDVITALIAAAGYVGPDWIFNVGAGVGRSVRSVIEDVCRVTGTPVSRVHYLPGRAADVPHNVLDPALIGREMGWQPMTDWSDGLRLTAQWMRGNGASDAHGQS